MSGFHRPAFLSLVLAIFGFVPLFGQSQELRVMVANMSQDMRLLDQQVRTLRLEIEEIGRENARLRSELAAATADRGLANEIAALSSNIEGLRREFRAADEALKSGVISEVTAKLNALAKETQDAINAVAEVIGEQPQISTPIHFSEDFPKTGLTYKVRSGDTLSKIAREQGSTIKDIQNANQIVDPSRDLRVGQTIFIPIAE